MQSNMKCIKKVLKMYTLSISYVKVVHVLYLGSNCPTQHLTVMYKRLKTGDTTSSE